MLKEQTWRVLAGTSISGGRSAGMRADRKPGQWPEQAGLAKLFYISYKNPVKALPRAVLAV